MAYVTDKNGNVTYQTSPGNTVAKDSVFDPNSKNYNASIANSSGAPKLTVADSLPSSWSNATVERLTGVARGSNGGNGTSLSNPNGNAASEAYNNSLAGGSYSGGMSSSQMSYQDALTQYQNQIATQAAAAKQLALKQAWEGNSQALNSQKSTVDNNYNSAANKLNAVRDARLPEFQQSRNAVSAESAQLAQRTKELMAATGRGDSGYNRGQQLSVELNRSNALSSLTGSENQFKTDVSNQLSDVDAQRVAALNDIAGKLQLGEKQYNDGTLSLTNQLESEKASGALKAFLEAQNRADMLSQQQFDNSFREKQFDQSANLAELQQQFQDRQFQAQQDAQLWEQQFRQQGYTADEAYRAAQMKMQQEIQAADQAYRYAALSASQVKSSAPKAPTSAEITAANKKETAAATADAFSRLNEMANQGKTRSQILKAYKDNYSTFANGGADMEALYKLLDENFEWDG